ncbi:MAG: phosphodiester glycosidase family protein [Gemmatimonadaceae bacterium]
MPNARMRVFALLFAASGTATAQRGDTLVARDLAPGVAYRQFTDRHGPFAMHLVRVNLRRRDIELREARALDQLKGRERVTDMVRRAAASGTNVLAAVNADFFWLTTGENENNQVIGGEWWKGLKVTDSPYDTYDNAHVQFAVDARGMPSIERYQLDGTAWARNVATPIITVNFNPSGNPEGSALYTSRYGATTPRDTTRLTAEATLISAGRRRDTLVYVRRGAVSATSGAAIPADGAVLSAYGNGLRTKEVQAMADGDTVKVLLTTLPRTPTGSMPRMVIGGWPRILRNGVSIAADAATLEGTISRNAELRHPRTAVGFSRDSATLYILTVDGRSAASVGVTLVELASIMRRLGAWQAMNFDGGGSTSMVIEGTLMNVVSDTTGERAVGNALMVVRKTPATRARRP